MKIKIILFLFVIFGFNCYSQKNRKISYGDIVKDRQFLIDKNELTACDENGNFVAIRPHRINGTLRNYFIEFFDGLNYLERKEIKTRNNTKILDVFIKNNKAHVFIREYDTENASLRIDLFDLNNKNLIQKELLHISKDDDKYLYNTLKNNNSISLNHDTTYLLGFPVIEGKIMYTYVQYFNPEFNTISSHKIYPNKEIKKKNTLFLNISLHNKKTYILYSLKDEQNNSYYQLIEFKNQKTRDLVIPIDNDIYHLVNVKAIENEYLICGLFSRQKKGRFDGFIHLNVNLDTFKLTSNKLSNFIDDEAAKYFSGIFKGNRSIDIKDFFIDAEKNTYLIGQCYSIVKQQVPLGVSFTLFETASSICYVTYNPLSVSYKIFDDILISKISPDGELLWDKIFELRGTEKINSKSNKKDSSYTAFLYDNELHILMNGFINLEKEKLRFIQDKRFSKTNFYDILIDEDGNINLDIIFPNSESEILFRSENSHLSNGYIMNLGQGNMRKQLLKLKL